jgi:hypothetical protein
MNKCKFLVVLVALFMPMLTTVASAADIRQSMDRWEFGVSAGVGFYVGQEDPLGTGGLNRVMSYDALGFGEKPTLKWPGIETFGFSLGYRIDTRWHVKLQTTRQRLCFAEYVENRLDTRNIYYNAMWHLDAMAECNILPLGNVMMANQGIYNVVPYVGFGFGITMYNEEATLRKVYNYPGPGKRGAVGSFYPRVGYSNELTSEGSEWAPAEVGVGVYIPVAFGVKWRVNDNVQLKGTFQYQLYLTPDSNLEGGSYNGKYAQDRPTFDQLNKKFGANHDCLFSLSAIFNFGKWYEDRLITY